MWLLFCVECNSLFTVVGGVILNRPMYGLPKSMCVVAVISVSRCYFHMCVCFCMSEVIKKINYDDCVYHCKHIVHP